MATISLNAARLWCFMTFVLTLTLFILYAWYQPYYNQRINSIRAAFMAPVVWAAFCSMVHVFLNFDSESPRVVTAEAMYFSGIFVVIPLAYSIVWLRRYLLLQTPRDAKLSAMETELKARLMLQRVKGKDENSKEYVDVVKDVADLYSNAVQRLPHSSMICVLHANFMISFMKQPLLARRALLLAVTRSPAIDENFIIFKLRKDLEENSFRSDDVVSFVAREKYLKQAMESDERCCNLLLDFWRELSLPQPDDEKVRILADAIGESSTLAQTSYKKLMKLRDDDIHVIQLYVGFLTDIANDPEKAAQLKVRWQHLQYNESKKIQRSKKGKGLCQSTQSSTSIH